MATILDVSKLSGVSTQTVSRVLNNHPYVSLQTRQRVEAAITKLGYRPNPAARALSNGKTRNLGVVSANTTLFGPASTIHAVQNSARESGYSISLYSLSSIDIGQILLAVDELQHSGVDGLLLNIPTSISLTQLKSALKGSPVILLENENRLNIPSVNVDQYQGAQIAIKHLMENGHRNIAHIAGPQDWFDAKRRYQGWRYELKKHKCENSPSVKGDWSAESGYAGMKKLLEVGGFTAVFVANDAMALGALKYLNEQKLDVPGDLSLIGFDDISESSYFIPALTTIRQDFQALGKAAIELLLSSIRGEKISNEPVNIKPSLVERQSVGKVGRAICQS